MPTDYALYLRKSRADLEAEAHGEGDTLARHEHILMELAKSRALPIGAIYREIVSGERIANRPVMQQLLSEVEDGRWKGVLVTETSRLARGDTIDQGIVAQAFKLSGTLIVTPSKVYDPTQEADEEWMEFGLFMSRQEYRMIRRRMTAGMNAAKREGRFIGNVAPYGYERFKLDGRGWSLRIVPKRAEIVRMIFKLYNSGLGYSRIEKRLNELHIPAPKGEKWSSATIPGIIQNPHYIGMIPAGRRPGRKVVKDGEVKLIRPRQKCELYPGMHEPIISREAWDKAQAHIGKNREARVPAGRRQSNPLAGLLVCDCCGKNMQRRPQTGRGSQTQILCPTRGCPTVAHNADELEDMVIDSLRVFLAKLEAGKPAKTDVSAEYAALEECTKKLKDLEARQRRTFELVEDGTYTREIFLARQAELTAERVKIEQQKAELEAAITKKKQEAEAQNNLAPAARQVLEAYNKQLTAEDRNRLLKKVIDHIDYHKRKRTRWNPESDLSITLHPVVTYSNPHR